MKTIDEILMNHSGEAVERLDTTNPSKM